MKERDGLQNEIQQLRKVVDKFAWLHIASMKSAQERQHKSQMPAMFSAISRFVEWTHGVLVTLFLETSYKFDGDRNIFRGHVAKQYHLSNLSSKVHSIETL